jgi:hypothetical protein
MPLMPFIFPINLLAQSTSTPGGVATWSWLRAENYNTVTGVWTDASGNGNGAITRTTTADSDNDCSTTNIATGAGYGGITGTIALNNASSLINFNPNLGATALFRVLQLTTALATNGLKINNVFIASYQTAKYSNNLDGLFYVNNGATEYGIRGDGNNWGNGPGNGGSFHQWGATSNYGSFLLDWYGSNVSDFTSTSCGTAGKWFIGGAMGNNAALQYYRPFTGQIAEVIINTGTVYTAAQEDQIFSYLATKYGLTIPTTLNYDYTGSGGLGVYWYQSPTGINSNSGYTSNVTVIGRQTTSQNLDQEQSYSASSSIPVYLGANNSIASSNAIHGQTLSDNTYEAFGDNGGATTMTTTVSSGAAGLLTNIMPRTWKVQETGTVGSVAIAIPAALFTGTNQAIVLSASPTFASGNTVIYSIGTQTINGVSCALFNVDLSNGQYFTFGTTMIDLALTLVNFKVEPAPNNTVLVSWNTASETQNAGYYVQRSIDSGNAWINLKWIPSQANAGNSNQLLNYDYIDPAPVNRLNEYRLQEISLEGTNSTSQTVSIDISGSTCITVYPNPTIGPLKVSGMSLGSTYRIIALNGQTEIGPTNAKTLDLSRLAAGIYLLQVSSGKKTETFKIVKK